MSRFFDPPKPKPQLPADKVDKIYPRMRFKVFLGAFLGYAGYYLVRKNLSLAAPGMIDEGLINTVQVGVAMSAVSIAYAFSKFIMGSVSDRSDARKFLVTGLILASLVMIATGLINYNPANPALNMGIIFVMMLFVGWISGMGWPPCGRVMAHWFSQNERSFKMSLWNTSHSLGSGTLGLLATAGMSAVVAFGVPASESWRGTFILPALVALAIAVICWFLLRDTPQSCGLPSINDWRHDYSGVKSNVGDTEKIPFKTLFVDYIFKNKMLWAIAFANIFVYMIRYGISDWAPTFLQDKDIMTEDESNLAFSIFNYVGIVGTIVCGWISSKFFKGRCAPPNVIFMSLVLVGVLLYIHAGAIGSKALVYISLGMIGFFIYGPVALIGIQALNLVPKNAAGTAAGFVGLFGYLFGDAIVSKITVGAVVHSFGWSVGMNLFPIGCALAIILCAIPWKAEKV